MNTLRDAAAAVFAIGLSVVVLLLVLKRFFKGREGISIDAITSERYTAKRAFEVAEFEDEGSKYFLELADGSVLYLTGQYLYDYEAIDDDPELEQPRLFPCTEFVVHRHAAKGYVVEIDCRGMLLEPEVLAPFFRADAALRDGTILTTQSYDDLRRERTR